MNYNKFIYTAIIICFLFEINPKALAQPATIELVLKAKFDGQGKVYIDLLQGEAQFKAKEGEPPAPTQKQSLAAPRGDRLQTSLQNVPYGDYAIRVFWDRNSNGKLDRNGVGAPSEAYGFSNDARATFGPPSFSKAHFSVKSGKVVQVISLR